MHAFFTFYPLILLFFVSPYPGFNLDPRIPIIKTAGRSDIGDRYFGFSVAQHRTSSGEPLILVGSPQDDNLQPGTSRSGALWKCGLSMRHTDCIQVPTDGKRYSNASNRNTYGLYDGEIETLQEPINSEIKDGQWLGGIVESQGEGGNVIVCAHRYTVRDINSRTKRVIDSKRGMVGMCYILDPELTFPQNKMIGSKNVVIVREGIRGPRLEVKGNFDDHSTWGVCQLGTSAGFVGDSGSISEESLALFGAPGCFAWRGNLFASEVGSQRRYEVAVSHKNSRDYDKHGHLGLSVASGKFDGDILYFVSGAPQAGKTGSVFFFLKSNLPNFEMDSELTLHGEVFGEGFGHALVTLDINGDTNADLLVGAPFFEEGSIYIYPSRYTRSKRRKRAGDLNRDGFDDFAVGAPYESDVGGAVYIFFGGSLGLRSRAGFDSSNKISSIVLKATEVASQIITGKDFSSLIPSRRLETFGGSLSGGMDMDRNGYPDLLIGAYSSNYVFLLRSRPIIDIETSVDGKSLEGVDPGASGCEEHPDSEESCFSFKTCFKVLHEDKTLFEEDGRLNLNFVIEVEPEKPIPRISLRLANRDSYENRSRTIADTIIIEGDENHCTKIIGYVGGLHADIQTPVPFSMSYSIIQDEPLYDPNGPLPFINNYPILNQDQAKKTFQATFDKDCGEDDICKSAIVISPFLRDKSGLELNKAPTKNGYYTIELGSLKSNVLILDVHLNNTGEAAYESTFHVLFPHEAVSYVDSIEDKIIQFYLNTNTSSIQIVDPSTFVNLVIVTRAEVKIVGGGSPSVVYYGGKRPVDIKGESALLSTTQIGPQVSHKYQVMNGGPSTVSVVTVQVDWPIQVENGKPQGKWLMYLTEEPVLKNGKGYCVLPAGVFSNPLNYSYYDGGSTKKSRRLKRELERIVTPSFHDPLKGIRIFTFDCNRGTAKCINITCQIYDLGNQESVTILIKSRLWNATLEEDYNLDFDPSEEVKVEVFSKAMVMLDGDVSQNIADDYFAIRTVAHRISFVTVENNLPWWIILIAVLAGLLLLVIISLALWKMGFFKRKRISEEDDDDSGFLISAHFEKKLSLNIN
ncbi:ITGA7 [Lepeophtheirus salmonis]|uniref:ITGA7 n=1 Tax=Lepeophtheirus salmonis TaxID=72036 RepID=A0A7R8GZE3_LEPSM|nr:ITGA7 [Lepeophtheirus salmonis]CAF2764499.1 ITGA7 [Lepeophtheirus salmonis]